MGRPQTEETKQKIRESWHRTHLPYSEETKAKIGASQKGRKRSAEFCLKNGLRTKGKKYSLGSKRTEEQRRRLSESAKRGAANNLWRGGVSTENQLARHCVDLKLWRESVFEKDGWKCRGCGKNGGFNAHHIENFHSNKEGRFAVENGITLCVACHVDFHKWFGKHKNTKEQILIFLDMKHNEQEMADLYDLAILNGIGS
jgi:hypothetical protein